MIPLPGFHESGAEISAYPSSLQAVTKPAAQNMFSCTIKPLAAPAQQFELVRWLEVFHTTVIPG